MGFQTNTEAFPRFWGYSDALAYCKKTTPVRTDGRIPLAYRRQQQYTIRTGVIDGVNVVLCKMYTTDIATFFEDGRLLLDHGAWPSRSTADVVSALVHGIQVRHFDNGLVVRCEGGEFRFAESELMLEGEGNWTPIDPPKTYVTRIDRAKLNEVAKQYKPFRTELLNWFKLVGTDHATPTYPSKEQYVAFALSEQAADRHELCLQILTATRSSRSLYGAPELNSYGYMYPKYLGQELFNTAARISAFLRKVILKNHSEEVCYREELPYGVVKKDVNKALLD